LATKKIQRLLDEQEQITAAPYDVESVKQRVAADIDAQCKSASVAHMFDPSQAERGGVFIPPIGAHGMPNLGGVALRYVAEQLKKDLFKQADAIAAKNGKSALSAEERAAKLRASKASILLAERVLECLYWSALQAGQTGFVLRASDPRAILRFDDAGKQ
jgi:hypothetical protein